MSQAKGKVNIHLRLDKETTDSPDFLTITLPPGEVASTGEYLSSVCKHLFGQTDGGEVVVTNRTSEMDAAMAKARASANKPKAVSPTKCCSTNKCYEWLRRTEEKGPAHN